MFTTSARSLPAALALALIAGAFAPPAAARAQIGQPGPPATEVPAGYVAEFGTMWTFDAPPLDYWRARYGFAPTEEWLDHLRLAAIRLPGCSSSFVSQNGLILTNHHCARGCIAAVTAEDEDLLRTGFVAGDGAEERVCPGVWVDQLVGIEDITARIRGAIADAWTGDASAGAATTGDADPGAGTGDAAVATAAAEQVARREAAIEDVTGECEAATGLRCQVVAFYNGGMYSLYTYRRFDDVRLVMAPELGIAHFGGDPDNFTYPRFAVDMAFLRAYQDGSPVRPEHWLEWDEAGADDGEPVFIVGNPGSTGRLLTLAQMEYLRDIDYPARLAEMHARIALMRELADEDPAAARRLETGILGLENSIKATTGYLSGLLDESIMARKAAFEDDFRDRILSDPELRDRYGDPWAEIADAQLELATFADQARYYQLGGPWVLATAMNLVALPRQAALPAADRLPAFAPDRIDRTRELLLRDRPLDRELERRLLAAWLTDARDELGDDDALVRTLLAGRAPDAAAAALVDGTALGDVAERRRLVEGGAYAVEASTDPLIVAARELEPAATSFARRAAALQTVISANGEKLGEAIYDAYGKALPPDATFTLRISDGVVRGFPMNGTIAPYKTVVYGLFARAASFDHQDPFRVPDSWRAAHDRLDMTTPVNFVSTGDIIGGNSGSPVVDREGRVVGLVFDGNIEMLPNRFIFTDEVSRSVSVHSAIILEALRKVYDADHIVREILGTTRSP